LHVFEETDRSGALVAIYGIIAYLFYHLSSLTVALHFDPKLHIVGCVADFCFQ